MVRRDHQHVAPAVGVERGQRRLAGQRLGSDADIGLSRQQQLDDVVRRGLLQRQRDVRVGTPEFGDDLRQRIARLRMRGGDRQPARMAAGEFVAGLAQVLRLEQQALDDADDLAARRGQAGQPLAVALEDLHAELLLQLADLARHAGLRGVQRVGDLGQIELAAHRLADRSQLLEVHRDAPACSPANTRMRRGRAASSSPSR